MSLEQLQQLLDGTMLANQSLRQQAEGQLQEWANMVDRQGGLTRALLEVATSQSLPDTTRHAASIFFKNLVKGHWDNAKYDHIVMENDKAFVRDNLLDVMLVSPEYIRRSLSEAICIICEIDFPARWPQLVGTIANKLQQPDVSVIQGALETAHAVFARYQKESQLTQALVEELTQVNSCIAFPLLNTLQMAQQHQSHVIAKLCVDVFYDLCYLDFGVEVEQSLGDWMQSFLFLVKLEVPQNSDVYEAIADLKGAIIKTLALFLTKYDEEFTPYLQKFCEAVWQVLQQVSEDPLDDATAIGAMDFLAAAMKGMHYTLFLDPQMQKTICDNVIVRNVLLRESDVEMFEDEAQEYIQRDIEGSDVHTRRRAASELGQAFLSEHFNGAGFQLLSTTIETLFNNSKSNPNNWREMDGALFLMMSLSSQSGMGALHSTSNVRQLTDLAKVYNTYVKGELNNTNARHLILKADAIKFVCCFRQQIPRPALLEVMPILANWITFNNDVIVTYAAHAIDKLLNPKDNGFRRTDIEHAAVPLTQALMKSIESLSSPNERVARATFRVLRVVGDLIDNIVPQLLRLLNNQIIMLAKNPTNPTYNHYIFESLSAVVSSNHTRHMQAIEGTFWGTFMDILAAGVDDFMPYIFQIIAQFVSVRSELSAQYVEFFAPLVTLDLYKNKRLISSLVRLMRSYIEKCAPQLDAAGHTEGILDVFQMLVSSKVTDHDGFEILSAMTESYPNETMTKFLPNIMSIFFSRLTNSKTTKFVRCMILYLSLFVVKVNNGASVLFRTVESIQRGIFRNLFENVWLPDTAKIIGGAERKLSVVALTRFVSECPEITCDSPYSDLWGKAVFTICKMHHCGHDKSETPAADVSGPMGDAGAGGFFGEDDSANVGSGALLTNVAPPKDVLPQIADGYSHFTRELGNALQGPNGSWCAQSLRNIPTEAYESLRQVFPQL